MRRVRGRDRRRARAPQGAFEGINITPFTDVLLVLLIIFMIAGSAMAPTGLGLTGLAAGEATETVTETAGLIVDIDADGITRLRLKDELLNWDEVARLPRSTTVTLRIEPETRAERIVAQYDRLLEAGLSQVEWAPPEETLRQPASDGT